MTKLSWAADTFAIIFLFTALIVCVYVVSDLSSYAWQLAVVAQQEPPAPGHEGQPDHCSNAKTAPKAHKCECKKTPGEDGSGCDTEDKACKVYCRKNHCHCFHPACDS